MQSGYSSHTCFPSVSLILNIWSHPTSLVLSLSPPRSHFLNLFSTSSFLKPKILTHHAVLVYIAEYTINQGVSPTLLFPLKDTPFTAYRQFYPMYAFLYQLGVFISRSSISFLVIPNLYAPSFLQVANLVLLATVSPSIPHQYHTAPPHSITQTNIKLALHVLLHPINLPDLPHNLLGRPARRAGVCKHFRAHPLYRPRRRSGVLSRCDERE